MQFFFRGLLVAEITYFFKLGHNNHGPIFTVGTLGLLRAVETMGLLRAVATMAFYESYHQWALYGPYDRLAKHGPKTDHIMAVKGLELESSVYGPTIMGRH